jgi:hypothetical protein
VKVLKEKIPGCTGLAGWHPRFEKQVSFQRLSQEFGLLIQMSFLPVLLLVFCGCAGIGPAPRVLAAAYRPENVFVWGSSLPVNIRRVALLPVACEEDSAEMSAGRDALEPIVRDELNKAHRFEIVSINPAALRSRTGKAVWSSEETLPHDLLTWLSETRGCDGVLFCQLTVFRGYAPLAVGWRMRLVDTRTRATVWAGDEVFDAGHPGVQAGARHFQLTHRLASGPAPEEWVMENSPRQFGQYAAARMLQTLPSW